MIYYAKRVPNCCLIIDESYMELDRYDKNQEWVGKSSRHYGHAIIVIGHSLADVTKGIRDQCTNILVLGCTRTDAEKLSDYYDDDRILKATRLPTGHFVRVNAHDPGEGRVTFGHVDPNNMKIYIDKPPA